jgi:signal transduction histidine kinase
MTFLKKLLILFLVFIGFCFNIGAQTINEKDSLRALFSRTKQDTSSALALLQYGEIIEDEFIDSASFYYQKGLILSQKLNYKRGLYEYYDNMVFLTGILRSNPKKGLVIAKEFATFAHKENNPHFIAQSHFSQALCYQKGEKYDSAIYHYGQSLAMFEKLKKYRKIPRIYANIGNIYQHQKMYDIALEYANKTLMADLKIKDTLKLIIDNVNLSVIYFEKKNHPAKEKCNKEAYRLAILIKNPHLSMVTSINMGEMFKDKKQYDSCLYYLSKANKFALDYGSEDMKTEILIRLADAYEQKKDFQKALIFLNLALRNKAISNITLEKKQFLLSLKMKIYNGVGKFKEASELFVEYEKLTDSTTNIATQEKVLEFNNKLKKAESEKVILSKEVEINKQKTWLYLLSISGIALLLLGFLYYRYQNKKQEAKSQRIKLLEKENEFVAVKSSLEGQLNERVRISKEIHDDLGSSLTSISLLTEVLKTKVDGIKVPEVAKISATSARMVDSMNEIVWALNVHNDTLDSLVAFIRKYARDFLQDTSIKLVFEEDVNQDFTLQGNVRRSIYLVVKEAINNVVKHADAQQVKLNIQANDNKLTIVIEDDGKGINEEKKSAFGNGLRNMKQRIEDIGGTFAMYQTKGMVVSIEYNF